LQVWRTSLIVGLSFITGLHIIPLWLGATFMISVALVFTFLNIVLKWKNSPYKTDRFGYEQIEATITDFSTKTERSYDQEFTLVSLEYEFEYQSKVHKSTNIDFVHHKNSSNNSARFQPQDAIRLFSGFEIGKKIFVKIYMGNLKSISVLEIATQRTLDSSRILVPFTETA
jgi:hypothetical protein